MTRTKKKTRMERFIDNTAFIENYVSIEMGIQFFPDHDICAKVHKHVLEKMGLTDVEIIENGANSYYVASPEVDNNLVLTGIRNKTLWTKKDNKRRHIGLLKQIFDAYNGKKPAFPGDIRNMKISVLEAAIISALVDNPYDVLSSAVKQRYAEAKPKYPETVTSVEKLLTNQGAFKGWREIPGASKPVKFRIANGRLRIDFDLNENRDGWLKSGLVIMRSAVPEVFRSSYIGEKLSKILDVSELGLEVARASEDVEITKVSTDMIGVTSFELEMPIIDIATAFNAKRLTD